ncbi:hypothetical protein A2U01_0070760, partial [Trifolium medium]|nr:hypothetical protein [Trifolium medium]
MGDNGNNRNGRRGRNSPNQHSSDNGSSRDRPYENERRKEPNRHPGRIPRTLEKPPKLETYDGTTDP